ncbi:hypothetical protein HYN48_13105 [Flavobacterium magnum]|uniref:Lipoprotein n=1 Tax=Flavobacterium magnum TaxID=2162713 RepID=A0A2S0RG84_9FLAO|nr:hypothetical protein [Flavobacterium magnum]AWA30937.1 hypothetical protein HYN48_13105 [Flavobacterium magnum]
MKFLKIILLFLICIVFHACDTSSFAEIINKTDKEITVEIFYNRSELEKVPGLKSIKPYFNNDAQLINFDSVSMIGRLKINPNDTLIIDSNRGSNPRFKFIRTLKIFADDTIKLNNQNEISKSFKETSPGIFAFEFK